MAQKGKKAMQSAGPVSACLVKTSLSLYLSLCDPCLNKAKVIEIVSWI